MDKLYQTLLKFVKCKPDLPVKQLISDIVWLNRVAGRSDLDAIAMKAMIVTSVVHLDQPRGHHQGHTQDHLKSLGHVPGHRRSLAGKYKEALSRFCIYSMVC